MQDAVLPLSQPIRGTDGSTIKQLAIPRGTNIVIALMACNRSKTLWGEDADEWKPERWLAPLPAAVERAAIPGVYSHMYVLSPSSGFCEASAAMRSLTWSRLGRMTFLGGGRSCM